MYRLTQPVPKHSFSSDNLFQELYARFSMEMIAKLFAQYSIQGAIQNKAPAEISRKVALSAQKDFAYTYLVSEYLMWILLQSKRDHYYIPTQVQDEDLLATLIQQAHTRLSITQGLSRSEDQHKKEARAVLKKLNVEHLFRNLRKHYLPTLVDRHPKEYEVLGEKGAYNPEIEEPIFKLKLINKEPGTLEHSFPTSSIVYIIPTLGDAVTLPLEYNIPYSTYQRGKSQASRSLSESQLHSIMFQLLQLYFLGEKFSSDFREHPDIVEPRLKALYDQSTECISTPFGAGKRPYFSLYPELEQHLGSKGSYFHLQPQSGIFSVRPVRSYLMIQDTLNRTLRWLNEAEKAGRKLTILYWFPNMIRPGNVVFHQAEKNITKEFTVLGYAEEDLLPTLEASPYVKNRFSYYPGAKLPKNSANFTHNVFVLASH